MNHASRALLLTFLTACSTIAITRLSCMTPQTLDVLHEKAITDADIFIAAQQGNLKLVKLAMQYGFDPQCVDASTNCTLLGTACKSLNQAIMIARCYIVHLDQRWYPTGNNISDQLNSYFQDIAARKQVVAFLANCTKPPVNDDDEENIKTTCRLLKGQDEDANLSHKLLRHLVTSGPYAG